MQYTVKRLTVEHQGHQYCDEWETVMVAELVREDGETGDVWIVAGVPPYQRGTAKAAGHEYGLRSVRVYGDSPDYWCPDSFDPADVDEMIAAVEESALAKDAGCRDSSKVIQGSNTRERSE